jgi:pilus assembly protein CpaF
MESQSPEGPLRLIEQPYFQGNPALPGIKTKVHQQLLTLMDLGAIEFLSADQLRNELAILVRQIVKDREPDLSANDVDILIAAIQNEVMGLGPIEPLMADPSVSDILVNGPTECYVERHGKLELTNIQFTNDEHLMRIIDKIVSRIGRRVDESSPMVDARLPDGSRVNAIIPPLALDGPVLSIRRFSVKALTAEDLIANNSLSEAMIMVIKSLVKAKINFLISGGTGSGKTTLLNLMSGFVPDNERIITIEDAAELRLQQPHVVRLETRPPNVEGAGEVTQRALVKNSLRMRPDRIVVGEVRGAEVLDMLQAMNTGHEGSMTTIHANSARDALIRLENMVGISGYNVSLKPLRQQIVSAISVVIQVARMSDGSRKLISVQEIIGMEGDVIEMHEIFHYKQKGISPTGAVMGDFLPTGIRPKFMDRLIAQGIKLSDSIFDPRALAA